jgi:hypothetical protein
VAFRGGASLLRLIPDDKSPIAATVLGSIVICEDACDRCRVRNPTYSKGNPRGILDTATIPVAAATFLSKNVGEAAGMGVLGRIGFGWTLTMRLTVSGLGCGLAVSREWASPSRRLNVNLVCGEGNSDGSDSTLLPPRAGRRDTSVQT